MLEVRSGVIPDPIFPNKVRQYLEIARPLRPESRLEVIPMRRDELMKPDFLSEILLVVVGLLLVILVMVGIAAVMGK